MYRWFITAAALLGVTTPIGRADSIWDRRDPRYANLWQDNRARNVGDVITVAIAQTTIVDDADQRNNVKTSSATAAVNLGALATPAFSASSNRQFSGNAAMSSNQVFTDTMGALVVDMLPNGNLVIEGYRTVVVAGEERVMRMTGIVRPADIAYPNFVSSNSVANLRMSYLGRGPQTRSSMQNYIGRIFNRIWPF